MEIKASVEDGADHGERAEVADCAEMGGIVLDKEVKDVVSVGARHAVEVHVAEVHAGE